MPFIASPVRFTPFYCGKMTVKNVYEDTEVAKICVFRITPDGEEQLIAIPWEYFRRMFYNLTEFRMAPAETEWVFTTAAAKGGPPPLTVRKITRATMYLTAPSRQAWELSVEVDRSADL